MDITIIGGGNVGTLMAAVISQNGHRVTVHSSRPQSWGSEIRVYAADDTLLLSQPLYRVTNDLAQAVAGADMIFVTVPAQGFSSLAQQLYDCVSPGQAIGIIPGSGGAEFAFRKLVQRGCVLFGLQRVPYIARLKEYGHCVYRLGDKPELQLASIPADQASQLCEKVFSLMQIPCVPLPNYLCVTLTPSNPILHTARLYAMFRDYHPGVVYPRNFLFYEEWNDLSSRILLQCDQELQTLCQKIPLELSSVRSLKLHYESPTAEAMTGKIRSITAFHGITSPMVQVSGGWIPDFASRYFGADFPYGLRIIRDIAKLFDLETPAIDQVWGWYLSVTGSPDDSFPLPSSPDAFLQCY